MRITLLGCGRMGRAVAYGLAMSDELSRLTLVDPRQDRAQELARWLAERTGRTSVVRADLEQAVTGQDAVAMAVPWPATELAIDAVLAARVPAASITRPPVAELAGIDARARAAGVPLLLPVGLEPGLTELLAARLASQLPGVETISVLCGAIPRFPQPPLRHRSFFGGDRDYHLAVAQRPAWTVTDGRLSAVPRFSGLEVVRIDGVGKLEAYHDGMVGWLTEHPALRSATRCTQKTLRWPGFAGIVHSLAELGLLDEQPVTVDEATVVPKRVVERVLEPLARPGVGEEDLVVLQITGQGRRDGRTVRLRCLLIDYFDHATSLSATARTTGFTLAAAVRLLADRAVGDAGWQPPHLVFSDAQIDQLLSTLVRAGVRWSPAAEIEPSADDQRRGLAPV